jgi:cytidyltransferase-like protein
MGTRPTVAYLPGVFDLLHHGHLALFERARRSFDRVVIGVHTDEFTATYKREPSVDQDERARAIRRACPWAEAVVLVGAHHREVLEAYSATHIVHGSDWELESYKRQIRYYDDRLDMLGVEIVLLPYTNGVSTTSLLTGSSSGTDPSTLRAVYFDFDNTLVVQDTPTLFAVECLQRLRTLGLDVLVISNNNRYTPDHIQTVLAQHGMPVRGVHTSLSDAAEYLLRSPYSETVVGVWGTPAACAYLQHRGLRVSGVDDAETGVLLVLYRDDFTYTDLATLATRVRDGVPYVQGNVDTVYPDATRVLPDTGSVVSLLTTATGILPIHTCGKPAMSVPVAAPYDASAILYVGDSEHTDRPFALAHGFRFLRVGPDGDIGNLGVLLDMLDHGLIEHTTKDT